MVYIQTSLSRIYQKLSAQRGLLLLLIFTFIPVKYSLSAEPELFLVTEHLPPYQILDKNHQLSGFSVELVHEIAKRSGYTYQMDVFSWVRAYNLALQKANHCIFSIARLPLRENLFQWIGAITEVNNAVVWGLKNNNRAKISTLDQVKDYLVAVNKNDVTHLGLLERGFIENKNLYVLEHTDSLLNLLENRPEIDFIVADDITISYRAKLAGVDINSLERIIEIDNLQLDFYLACSKQTPKAMIDRLTASLNSIHSDGFYKKTLTSWQSKMTPKK